MTQAEFAKLIQQFVAVESIPASALRNQGKGVAETIREQLVLLNLAKVPTNGNTYRDWLDRQTDDILDELPIKGRPWGTVRKAINLFMRACVCNHHLRSYYPKLAKIEALAELPVDGVIARALKRRAGRGALPAWHGMKWLEADAHLKFQTAAIEYAEEFSLPAPVYLDNYLWLTNR